MISQSRKNRQTTRRIRLAWATSSALTLFCFAGGAELCAGQNLISLGFEAGPSESPSVQLIGLDEPPREEPLDRLRRRSPEERWKAVKSETLPETSDLPQGDASDSLPTLEGFQEFQPFTSRRDSAIPEAAREKPPTSPSNDSASKLPVLPEFNSPSEKIPPRLLQSVPARPIDPFTEALSQPESREFRSREYVMKQGSLPQNAPLSPLRPLNQIFPYHDYESVRPDLQLDPDDLPPDIDVNRVPDDVTVSELPEYELAPRLSPETVFSWEPSNIWHNPLYFEDPTLERYGHAASPLLQPLISTSRLGVQLFGLPYQMSIDPVHKKRYILGWYRPGDEVPHQFYQVPFNLKAAAVQAGAVSAGVVILP